VIRKEKREGNSEKRKLLHLQRGNGPSARKGDCLYDLRKKENSIRRRRSPKTEEQLKKRKREGKKPEPLYTPKGGSMPKLKGKRWSQGREGDMG